MFQMLLDGLAVVFQPGTFLMTLLAIVMGTVFGALSR